MGAGALGQCSHLTWARPREPAIPRHNPRNEEPYPVFEIDVNLPEHFAMALPSDTTITTSAILNPRMADYLTLFSRTKKQVHHQFPLALLKTVLLEYLKRRNALMQQRAREEDDSGLVIVVPAAAPYPSFHLCIVSSLFNQRVQVIFDTSKQTTGLESAFSLSLIFCARCGSSIRCRCGWRQQHVILPQMELHTISDFIALRLPPRSPDTVKPTNSCHRLRLSKLDKTTAKTFEVEIYGHEVQRPVVERPYIVFKMNLCLGNLTWRIARRYREFVELHTRLAVLIEQTFLPTLPPTKWFSATEHTFLLQRQQLLGHYLKGIFMIEELQDSVSLLVFLGVLSASYVDHVALRSYRRQILHLQVLEYYTRPGDLILFNGRAKVSVLQRSMTRAEWDHVAIVVPSREGGPLQLLEATGDGVTLFPLTARLLAYSAYHVRYFALRKLRTPLLSRAVVNDLLERFTAEVEGLPYGLSIRRILHARQVQTLSRDSSFFCSELVAEAYKALGIISSSNDANDFWPGSFSPGGFVDTELGRHGASLSPEIIVDCKLLEVATATRRCTSPTV